MTFTVIEWFAFVFAIGIIVKLVFVAFNPKGWVNFAKGIYNSPAILVLVELILALVLFYYLLMELTIVQVFAALTLGALLTGLSFAIVGKETINMAGKLMKQKQTLKHFWLPILIWLALAIWTLAALF